MYDWLYLASADWLTEAIRVHVLQNTGRTSQRSVKKTYVKWQNKPFFNIFRWNNTFDSWIFYFFFLLINQHNEIFFYSSWFFFVVIVAVFVEVFGKWSD